MKKQFKRRKIIGHIKIQQPLTFSPEQVAHEAKKALDYLAPLGRKEHIDPIAMLILAVGVMDRNITGQERTFTEQDFQKGARMILSMWDQGLFAPGPAYPFTLKETEAAWDELPDANEEEVGE